MRKSFTAFIFCLFIIVSACASFTFAQDSVISEENSSVSEKGSFSKKAEDSDDSDKKNELTIWTGGAPRELSGLRKSSFAAIGFRYSRTIATTGSVALKYTLDFIPLAIINYNREQLFQSAPNAFFLQRTRTRAYGFGITPFGFQVNLWRKSKIQPFIGAGVGLLIFNKTIPDDRSPVTPLNFGKKLNFTPQGSAGIEYLTDSGRAYVFGFRFHHVSNASRGNINPGFNHYLFYFGYTFKKW